MIGSRLRAATSAPRPPRPPGSSTARRQAPSSAQRLADPLSRRTAGSAACACTAIGATASRIDARWSGRRPTVACSRTRPSVSFLGRDPSTARVACVANWRDPVSPRTLALGEASGTKPGRGAADRWPPVGRASAAGARPITIPPGAAEVPAVTSPGSAGVAGSAEGGDAGAGWPAGWGDESLGVAGLVCAGRGVGAGSSEGWDAGAGGAAGAGGGWGATRGGRRERGSTYWSSPSRIPRWTYGASCSGSPDGPGSAIGSPSSTRCARFTSSWPRWVSDAL